MCAAKNSQRREAKELNCVYKSDNCWETKSFMVEFLTLYFPSFLCSSSFSSSQRIVFMWFSRNFVTENEKRFEATFFPPVTWRSGKKRKEISDGSNSLRHWFRVDVIKFPYFHCLTLKFLKLFKNKSCNKKFFCLCKNSHIKRFKWILAKKKTYRNNIKKESLNELFSLPLNVFLLLRTLSSHGSRSRMHCKSYSSRKSFKNTLRSL